MDMVELEQMRREWVEVTRKNGFREGITDLLAHQYSKKTHFIFELLQNAEDALATEVHFRVEGQQLVFSHNGKRLFSDKDVESITSIGKSTKQSDYTQIGKHGIGFKAVFAYTHTPRTHSGDKHFDIEDVVVPCFLSADEVPADLKREETRFILPFDSQTIPHIRRFRELVPAETAEAEISDALKKLNIRTLLFLRNIEEIYWELIDGTKGSYLRETKFDPNHPDLRQVDVTDGNKTESWLVFERKTVVADDGSDYECNVEVAFLVENGKVVPARNTELVVYFPTEKKTDLAFLIQGPFKTTKARDNIKDDAANKQMLKTAAQLVADSLEPLRDLKFLNVTSYLALPLLEPEDSFFQPVYDRIRDALRTKPLLPANDGTFIAASEAKLARGKDLVDLFSKEQLGKLFKKDNLSWLDASITEGPPFANVHTYLVGRKKYRWSDDWEIQPLWEGLEVDADSLAPKLTAEFLGSQLIPWVIEFAQYASQNNTSAAIKRTPLVRLASGNKHVAIPADAAKPRPAWFAPQNAAEVNLSAFPIVHPELVKYDEIRRFLEKEGIREIDAIAIVEKSILPKYKDPNMRFDESVYHNDLRRIRNAYRNANDAEKSELKSILSGYSWLACLHASGKDTDCIVWKRPGTSDLFEKTDENKAWFGGLEDVGAFFLHPSVVETLDELTSCITCTSGTIIKNLSTEEYTITLSNEYWNHKRGLKGFDPRATIVGIESAFDNWNQARSIVLWNTLVSAPSKIISGETQFATNRQKLDRAPKKIEYTVVGKYCTEKAWLMNKSGTWCKPNPLLLTDLPEEYETESIAAKELAVKLGMRQAEREQALEVVTRGDHDLKRLIEHYHSVSEDERKKILKTIPHLIPPEPAPSFRDGLKNIGRPQRARIEGGSNEGTPPSNPERYQENLDSQVETGKLDHLSTPQRTTFSPVRDLPSNEEVRRFLYEEYCGLCQVTGTTFPKASPNRHGVAENYFEAYSLLSYTNTNYLNDAGNMLCVSADTMAKFNHASVEMKDFEKKIESFIQSNEKPDKVIVQIRLAGEECTITWSQRHFMRLVALYTKA